MYRLAILLALLTMLLAACGGGSDADESASSGPASAKTAQEGPKKAQPRAAKKDRPKPKPKPVEASTEPADEPEPEAVSSELAKNVEAVVRAALLQYRLEVASVELTKGGRHADVTVTEASACNAVASHEPSMKLRITSGLKTIKSVRFVVEGTGEELGYYVLDCERPSMPDGPGRVVLRHTGVNGPYESRRFVIDSKRWVIEWENLGSSLSVIVVPHGKRKREYYDPITSHKAEAGKKRYTRDGTYHLTVYGAGRWTVRVKEL